MIALILIWKTDRWIFLVLVGFIKFFTPSQIQLTMSIQFSSQQDYDAQDLKEFEETILQGVGGYDKEGKVSRKELTMILLTLARMSGEQ